MSFSELFTLEISGIVRTVRIVTAEYPPASPLSESGNQAVVDVRDIQTGVHYYGVLRSALTLKAPEVD